MPFHRCQCQQIKDYQLKKININKNPKIETEIEK